MTDSITNNSAELKHREEAAPGKRGGRRGARAERAYPVERPPELQALYDAQYVAAVFQSWRDERDRLHAEAGVIAALLVELGEVAVAFQTNVAQAQFRAGPTETWSALKLKVGELWQPNAVFNLATVYVRIKLNNELIVKAQAKGGYLGPVAAEVQGCVDAITQQTTVLQARLKKLGRT